MSQRFARVSVSDIEIGSPLTSSIYNAAGDLLLLKGRMITTQRQQTILLQQGYVDRQSASSGTRGAAPANDAQRPLVASGRSRREQDEDIFLQLSQWLNRLFQLFNLSQKEQKVDFSYQVLQLALEIQLQCQRRPDTVLAALQMDHDNHYGLIHALHCAAICELIAKGEHLTQMERVSMIAGALTHDFGIIAMQDSLHQQAEKPSDEQWKKIRQHPEKGEALLREQGIDDPIWLALVRYHHERLDGSGYPDGVGSDKLSVPVRIMSIADTYTAITRPTAFRKESTVNSALRVLYTEGDQKLDRSLVERFIKRVGIYPCGSLVRLNNKEVAVVVEQNKDIKQPKVMALMGSNGHPLLKPQARDLEADDLKIVGVEPYGKFRSLQSSMETLWGNYL
ncbi:HD-GYP domain-containing protein [Aestuariirhabdus litorea]|uniref:HD domain-containing protein n=1 Tax=Aestuariirhabdus litorea TaxID=2528527 RepID=A0A3P3VQZ3_9GAMM|nr:HD domain-containing phosphohydrolase [Aestuariirhabdus litorea]RRJ85211.1 HD domain-containing protein [Aestuariirhabdus litorea]RWW98432.1 HD domain-containing protein [Endozoicomonadaceae bacterium GTF-13]